MKTIITLDRANQPYGFPQLNASGGISASTLSTIGLTATTINVDLNNTDYINSNGDGSHILMINPNPTGQNVVSSIINGNVVAKWRTDYVGNISWVAGTTGEHDFFTQGDYGVGSVKMRIFNNGNVQIATSPIGDVIADTGYKLDVQGAGRFSASTNPLTLSGLTADTSDTNLLSVDGNGVVHTYPLSGLTGTTSSGAYLPLSGGTVTGRTIFTSGVTANTISQTQYIDFTTGTTNPSSVAGRLFFDSTQKALSYFDITNNQVPIAMGQQLYTRVWNTTGVQIDKGKVIAITGTSNNLPSAILARNVHDLGSDRPIGLAAENIPNNFEGLVLTNGILSGITLNTFTNGDTLYLSDTIPGGYVASTTSLAFTARTNEIGYVLQTGATTGKIYVNINNEDSNLSLTDKERNILEGNVISGGVYEYTGMTQGTGQTINVAYARGWIVKNTYEFSTLPDVTNIYYTGGTNIPLTNLATADATFILINSASTLVQQTSFPTPQQRRENIFLGKVVHPSRTSITSINQTVDFDVSPMAAIRDLWTPLKLINQGVLVSPHSTTLEIDTSAGYLWGNGIGWTTNQQNPDSVYISGTSPTTFQYRTRLGPITGGTVAGLTGNTTLIVPGYYDLNGVVTAVGGGSNESTNQRVYLFPTGLVRIQLGQKIYGNLAAAVAGSQTEAFTEYSLNRENGILIGIISVNKNATNLSDTAQAVFDLVSKFGEIMGGTGGLSTTTLQQAYDNSSNPEIVTNSSLGALSIQNGTGNANNVTNLFEGKNTATSTTSFIRADGLISGNTVSTPSFTANANGMTATTVSATTYYGVNAATGGTYSNGTITLRGTGTLGTISGLGGSGGGQLYYLNLSITQTPYREFSPIPTTAAQQTTGTSISSGVTSTLASFLTPTTYPNTNQLPGGIWGFYLHTYKDVVGSSFNTYVQVYKRTSGGTETLLFTTDPSTVTGVSPTPSMQITDAYYSGTSLNTSDRILVVVKGVNTGVSTQTITLVTEGSQYYSYATTPFGAGTPNYTTGGTYSQSTGVLTFTRTDGNTYTAGTFNYVTAVTESANVISVTSNGGSPSTYTIDAVTGGSYSNGTLTLSGTGNFATSITGFSTGSTGGAGITWNNATTTQSASVSNGYVGTATTLTTITLPSTAAFGTIVEVVGTGTGLWRISQNANQFIKFGITGTTTGTGGYLSATSQYDCVKLLCTSADTAFVVTSAIGNIFYN